MLGVHRGRPRHLAAPEGLRVTDRERTLEAVRVRGWRAVLLYPRTKKPAAPQGAPWPVTSDADEIAAHLNASGNLGLLGGEINGLAPVDIDDLAAFAEMERALGPLGGPWVETGSGKPHHYVPWEPRLPAKLRWHDVIVGEIQRGPGQQQVVCPPSIHPITGRPYRWLVDPVTAPLPRLPAYWRAHLLEPARVTLRRSETDDDLPLSQVREAALAQPGARRRPGGKVKFACPACVSEGHDAHQDNAAWFEASGRWGCAWASSGTLGRAHWEAIGQALGVLGGRVTAGR